MSMESDKWGSTATVPSHLAGIDQVFRTVAHHNHSIEAC